MVRIAGYELNSVVDGPGIRNVVFFQGCRHNCPECHNPQTHDMSGGYNQTIKNIVEKLFSTFTRNEKPHITISGGDPFYQEKELTKLVLNIKYARPDADIWVYTGFKWEEVYLSRAIGFIDVLVDGPYINSLRTLELPWRGSSNQRLVDCHKSLGADRVVLWEQERSMSIDNVHGTSVLGWLEKAEEGNVHYGRQDQTNGCAASDVLDGGSCEGKRAGEGAPEGAARKED